MWMVIAEAQTIHQNGEVSEKNVLERDNNSCVICKCNDDIQVHHIIPVKKFENEEEAHYKKNAVTLCAE